MAQLTFFTGPMNCGKSTLALQIDYTESSAGRRASGSCKDRGGESVIVGSVCRGRRRVTSDLDFWAFVVAEFRAGGSTTWSATRPSSAAEQIDQLAHIVEPGHRRALLRHPARLPDGDVSCPARLVELADRIEMRKPGRGAGAASPHNARTVGGDVTEGSQVVVGDTAGDAEVAYEVLCRKHHRRRENSAVVNVDLTPDPLPFGAAE